jgi:hypothetical protein
MAEIDSWYPFDLAPAMAAMQFKAYLLACSCGAR